MKDNDAKQTNPNYCGVGQKNRAGRRDHGDGCVKKPIIESKQKTAQSGNCYGRAQAWSCRGCTQPVITGQ